VLSWSGGDADDPGSYQVVDFQRGGSLWWLAGLFAAAVLALGRWRGLAALAALGARGLFTAAMRIGRDHVSSAVNTLVLAYAGASLPLMLIFSVSGRGLGDVVTTQEVATEIVRTLVGSIGLVASVPITTAVAAVVASREAVRGQPERPTRLASPFASRWTSTSSDPKAACSSPAAARHGPGPSSTSDNTVTTSRPPGASAAESAG
jgi:uncharacterized membrane protein